MIYKLFHTLISLPLTIYVNFICFNLKTAIHLPIFIDYKTRVKGLYKGCITIKAKPKFALIKYAWGHGSYGNMCNSKSYIIFNGKGKIIFEGNAQFAMGATLRTDKNGIISFGRNFSANQNFSVFSNTSTQFGNNCITGWNVNLRDSDGHDIIMENVVINHNEPIQIGNNVWLSSHCDILKGSKICDNSIVGFRTLVAGRFEVPNIIIAGVPGKIIKNNIKWKK